MKIRGIFDKFEAYGWETPTREIASKVGLKEEDIVRLDTNASPYAPVKELRELAQIAVRLPVNQYPDTSYLDLRKRLSRYCRKQEDRFVVTNGADEGLDIISKTLLDPGDEVIVPSPTYSMFRIVTELMGARPRYVPRREDFSLDVDKIVESVGGRTKLIFLCSPNNPTANTTPTGDVERLLKETEAAVAIDEAYFEFAGKSSIDLTDRYENLIICRTFSKAFSMAGVRVGYLVAKQATVDKLNLVRPPNSLSVISLKLAEAALENVDEMRANLEKILAERARVIREMRSMDGVEPYESETNFVLFKATRRDAQEVHRSLMEKGFVLRNLAKVKGIEACLRMTLATRRTNDRFLAALSHFA